MLLLFFLLGAISFAKGTCYFGVSGSQCLDDLITTTCSQSGSYYDVCSTSSSFQPMDDHTYTCWGSISGTTLQYYMGRGDPAGTCASSNSCGTLLGVAANNRLFVQIGSTIYYSFQNITRNKYFHFVGFTWSSVRNQMTLYYNRCPVYQTIIPTPNISRLTNLYFWLSGGQASSTITNDLTEAGLWNNRVLNASEIATVFATTCNYDSWSYNSPNTNIPSACSITTCASMCIADFVTPNGANAGNCTFNSTSGKCTNQCNYGYTTSGSLTRTCSSGVWSTPTGSCNGVPCPADTIGRSGVLLGTCGAASKYPNICSENCTLGYELVSGSFQRSCQGNGTLSPPTAVCQLITCPGDNSVLGNGTQGTCANSMTYNTSCTQTCNVGWTADPLLLTRKCQANKTLTPSVAVCTRITCPPDLGDVPHGNQGDCANTTDFNATCLQTCDIGYEEKAPGSTLRICQQNGTLTPSAVCQIITCTPDLSPITNGSPGNCSRIINFGETCYQSCNNGYSSSSNLNRTCQANKTLTPSMALCTPNCQVSTCQNGGFCSLVGVDPPCVCPPCFSGNSCSILVPVPPPLVSLSSPLVNYYSFPLQIKSLLTLPSCVSVYSSLNLNYSYIWYDITLASVVQVNTTKDLLLPPKSLSLGSHTFQVIVTTFLVNNASLQVTTNQTISITIVQTPLYISILGGNRSISASSSLSLDGSTSFDPDGSSLSYAWTCTVLGNPCTDLGTVNLQTSNLTFPSNSLTVGTHQFTLVISTSDGRNASQSVLIDVLGVPLPSVYITTPTGTTTINPQDSVNLLGVITGGINVSTYVYTWSETSGLDINNPQFRTSPLGSLSLILNSGLLQQGMIYTFKLLVNVTSQLSTQASVQINVNPVPQGGGCDVSPTTGIALTDQFTLSCWNWVSASQVTNTLSYSFSYQNVLSSNPITLTDINQNPTAGVNLPAGNLTFLATIIDQTGAKLVYPFGFVVVTPSNVTECLLQNYSQTLLSQAEALQNSDSMLQLVNVFLQMMLNLSSDTTCDNQSSLALKTNLWTTFLNTLNTATHQPQISNTLASQLAQVLIVLSEALFDPTVLDIQTQAQKDDVISLTIDVLRAIIYSIGDDSKTSSTVLLVLSKLLETVPCSLMQTVLDLITLLSQISVSQDQIPEAFVEFVAPRVNSTAIVANPTGGGVNITTGGLNFTLPAELLAQAQQGGSSPLNQAFVSITITRYDNALRRCRETNGVPQGDIISIDLSQLGNTIGVQNLSQPVEFFLPIDTDANFTQNVGCGQIQRLPACAWWDTNASIWKEDGCVSEGIQTLSSGDRVLKCACNHLTDFAVLLNEVTKGACPPPATPYQIFAIIYAALGVFSCFQLIRLLLFLSRLRERRRNWGKAFITCKWNPLIIPHLVIFIICLLRALGQANVGGVFTFDLGGKAFVVSFPYVLVFWLFTTVVTDWAKIIHLDLKNLLSKEGIGLLKPIFLTGNVIASSVIILFFCSLLTEWNPITIGLLTSITFAILYFLTGIAFLIYGSLVARQLGEMPVHGKKAKSSYQSVVYHATTCSLAARIQIVAVSISLCFIIESVIWAYSVIHTSQSLDIAFSCLDLTGLFVILMMYWKSINSLRNEGRVKLDSSKSKKSKQDLELSSFSPSSRGLDSPSHESSRVTGISVASDSIPSTPALHARPLEEHSPLLLPGVALTPRVQKELNLSKLSELSSFQTASGDLSSHSQPGTEDNSPVLTPNVLSTQPAPVSPHPPQESTPPERTELTSMPISEERMNVETGDIALVNTETNIEH